MPLEVLPTYGRDKKLDLISRANLAFRRRGMEQVTIRTYRRREGRKVELRWGSEEIC